jgi:hypothetical protein
MNRILIVVILVIGWNYQPWLVAQKIRSDRHNFDKY